MACHNNASWSTLADGLLEHSSSEGSLSYKGSPSRRSFQAFFWGGSPLIYM